MLRQPGFARLFGVRLAGQFGDGVFQAALAGAVLFDPQRQAHASDIASGFAVLLLPYSFIGPFAGVLLDRWWRQRVLTIANLLRAAAVIGIGIELAFGLHGQPLYASALVVISVNRFVLSALSVALPHVATGELLVTANAVSTTVGSIATTVGAAAAIGLRQPLGTSNGAYAAVAIVAVAPYLLAGLLGPPDSGAPTSARTSTSGPGAKRSGWCCAAWSPAAGTCWPAARPSTRSR